MPTKLGIICSFCFNEHLLYSRVNSNTTKYFAKKRRQIAMEYYQNHTFFSSKKKLEIVNEISNPPTWTWKTWMNVIAIHLDSALILCDWLLLFSMVHNVIKFLIVAFRKGKQKRRFNWHWSCHIIINTCSYGAEETHHIITVSINAA